MNKLDLRQVGTIYGLPLYVDVAQVEDTVEKDEILSPRDIKEFQVKETLQKVTQVQ